MDKPIVLSDVKYDSNLPYYFQNSNIDNEIYISQRASDDANALYIIDTWNSLKYNIGDVEDKISAKIGYNIYLYNANTDITLQRINDGDDNYKVIHYMKDGKMFVRALLKFDPFEDRC